MPPPDPGIRGASSNPQCSQGFYTSPSLQSSASVFLSSFTLPMTFKICSTSKRCSYGHLRRLPSSLRKRCPQDCKAQPAGPTFSQKTRHPLLEPRRPHCKRPDIYDRSSHGGPDLLDIMLCCPLTPAKIRDPVQNPLDIFKTAW